MWGRPQAQFPVLKKRKRKRMTKQNLGEEGPRKSGCLRAGQPRCACLKCNPLHVCASPSWLSGYFGSSERSCSIGLIFTQLGYLGTKLSASSSQFPCSFQLHRCERDSFIFLSGRWSSVTASMTRTQTEISKLQLYGEKELPAKGSY